MISPPNLTIYSDILEVSKKSGVPIKKILDVFYYLTSSKPVENAKLLQMVGVSKNALNQVKKELSGYLKPSSKETALMAKKIPDVKSLYNKEYMVEEKLLGAIENANYKKVLAFLENTLLKRPHPKRRYDQFSATAETTARRASLLDFFGDVKGKRLLFLGDDYFTSIATASLGSAENITVLDIDTSILREISNLSQKNKFRLKVLEYDARKSLPAGLIGKFDVVFTDPPYTLEGAELFISRAIELLDHRNLGARLYLCYGGSDRAKERFLPIYEVLTKSGLFVRWIFDKFNRYSGAESIGSASSLVICDVTPKTKPLIQGSFDKPIYTNY